LPVFHVFCDDAEAAPAYFRALSRTVDQRVTLHVHPARCGDSPSRIVDRAIREASKMLAADPRDRVWVLLDLEAEESLRKHAQAEASRAVDHGVSAALSDPCFEIWTLLHLENTGQQFRDCRQVGQRLAKRWQAKFGQAIDRKTDIDAPRLVPLRAKASANAKQHAAGSACSWTDVYKIIDEIDAIVDERSGGGNVGT